MASECLIIAYRHNVHASRGAKRAHVKADRDRLSDACIVVATIVQLQGLVSVGG